MALNSSGPISLAGSTTGQSIAVELGQSASGQISLNDTNVRTLAGVPSGAITMPTDFWGKSSATYNQQKVGSGAGVSGPFYAAVNNLVFGGSTYWYNRWAHTALDSNNNRYFMDGDSQNTYIHKYNSAGVFQWGRLIQGGPAVGYKSVTTNLMDVDSSGNVYVCLGGLFLTKLNSSGVIQWFNSYRNSSTAVDMERWGGLRVSSGGNIYVTVSYADQALQCGNLMKLDTNGNVVWAKRYNALGNANQYSTGILGLDIDSSENIYVCGVDYMYWDPSLGIGGSYNPFFYAKFNSSGGFVSHRYNVMGGFATSGPSYCKYDSSSDYLWLGSGNTNSSLGDYSISLVNMASPSSGTTNYWNFTMFGSGSNSQVLSMVADSTYLYATVSNSSSFSGSSLNLKLIKANLSTSPTPAGTLAWNRGNNNTNPENKTARLYLNQGGVSYVVLAPTGASQLPIDGTKTGNFTYSGGGGTYNYYNPGYGDPSTTAGSSLVTPHTYSLTDTTSVVQTVNYTPTNSTFTPTSYFYTYP